MNDTNDNAEVTSWLATPAGLYASHMAQTLLKAFFVWLSTKCPKLGIGNDIDVIVQYAAPALVTVGCLIWTNYQHKAIVARKADAVTAAVAAVTGEPAPVPPKLP
jgi:hypothetical protein